MQKTKMERICTFTGHRPKFFPWGDDLTDKRAMLLLLTNPTERKFFGTTV